MLRGRVALHDAQVDRMQGSPISTKAVSNVAIYTPDSAMGSPAKMFRGLFRDVSLSWHLAWRLAKRDISAQYRQSFLGYLWAFIMPIANTAVWIMLNRSGVVRIADTAIPYPVYVFTGTMIWQMLVEAVQSPLQQVTMSRSFLTKLNFPREALIVAGLLKQAFSLIVKFLILVPAIILLGVTPDWHLLIAPLALLVTVLTGSAVGLLISPIGMLYNDVGRVIPCWPSSSCTSPRSSSRCLHPDSWPRCSGGTRPPRWYSRRELGSLEPKPRPSYPSWWSRGWRSFSCSSGDCSIDWRFRS